MILLIKNANIFSPQPLGIQSILIVNQKIVQISPNIHLGTLPEDAITTIDLQGLILTSGFIDQHIHLMGAGGKNGFSSMTQELNTQDLFNVGTTTAVGLLGTDGSTKSIRSLYAKVMSMREQGLNTFMHTGYYGIDPVHVTDSIQDDLVFIEPILGCKIAISDIRSSYPTDLELLRILRAVRTGGLIAKKKGIMHVHLGALPTMMDPLFRLHRDYGFPVEHISPTHVGRTAELFEQALQFAQLGGSIDITTGASKFTDPYKCAIQAFEYGIDFSLVTFSTDGNAGLDKKDENGNIIGTKPADIGANLKEVQALINAGFPSEHALKTVTTNPAKNLGLKSKGQINVGFDADFCIFDDQWSLISSISNGIINKPLS
jgi:beta-aspartyl-dipeptidase (metallo-type)